MDSFIPLIFLFMALFFQMKKLTELCKYLSYTYPEEWKKLSQNALGGSHWSVINANLSESLKTGFFSTVVDEKIRRYKKLRLCNRYLLCVFVLLQLIYGISLAIFV
jgi:hypothetical protein